MGVFYIIGNDKFSFDSSTEKIIKSIPNNKLMLFDAKKINKEGLDAAFFTYHFTNTNNIVMIDNFKISSMADSEASYYKELLKETPLNLTVILRDFITANRFTISKKIRLFFSEIKKAKIIEAGEIKYFESERIIVDLARENGCKISSKAIKRLLEFLNGDLTSIENEIKKLAAYTDYTSIEVDDVEIISLKTAESGIYDVINSLEKGDLTGALISLKNILEIKTDPIFIANIVFTSFVNLYRAKLFSITNMDNKKIYEIFSYKAGDRKVSIALNKCNKFTQNQLSRSIELLYNLDKDLKSSRVDNKLLLEKAIIQLGNIMDRRSLRL
ncbi:MAG: DNA polymerase III subunit delta [Ruminococcaceae bacterium]|nr:DNA polymerase III subunit delta [Oscillospiraceae bacterium]